ncbi:hypothetical protein D3C81_2286100 [compost metagenome]
MLRSNHIQNQEGYLPLQKSSGKRNQRLIQPEVFPQIKKGRLLRPGFVQIHPAFGQ